MFVAGASAAVHADMGDQPAPEPSADLGFDVMPLPATPGYRSGVACMEGGPRCIAVGPSGVDAWDGGGWEPVSATGYDAIDITGNVGWATGDDGRIARLEIEPSQHGKHATRRAAPAVVHGVTDGGNRGGFRACAAFQNECASSTSRVSLQPDPLTPTPHHTKE